MSYDSGHIGSNNPCFVVYAESWILFLVFFVDLEVKSGIKMYIGL